MELQISKEKSCKWKMQKSKEKYKESVDSSSEDVFIEGAFI